MHTFHNWKTLLAIFLLALLPATPALAERLITDMAGRQVHLPDQVKKVYAVGHCMPMVGAVAPDLLVSGSRLPEQARRFLAPAFFEGKTLPNTGNRFTDEEVLKMAPDLVVMEAMPGAEERAERLAARLRTPVVLVDLNLLRLKRTFTFLGEVLQRQAQSQVLVDFIATHLDPIPAKARSIAPEQRQRVYYAEGPDGLSTNPAGSSHTQVLDYVGGINVAQVVNLPDEGMSSVSLEQIYLWQPDLILVWTPAADQLTTWNAIHGNPLWQRVRAVRENRVIQIPWLPYSWFDRPPSSNRIIGVLWLAQTLYPQVYQLDLEALTREYVRKFYHREISPEDARYLLGLAHPQERKTP